MKITLPLKTLSYAILLCGAFAAHAETAASTTQMLEAARASIKTANDLGWIWRDTEDKLKEAETAAAAGDDATAAKLAKSAKAQADIAVNQYYLEKGQADGGRVAGQERARMMPKRKWYRTPRRP